eukprot:TRINITY_DN4017_c2_g1_i1.p1 TRINITY_DN4017_c2_g1~~TRINITY_DN4017_c2_g1_i1.p1  ORF type:complete len:230 (+),score=74.41 TRINITY_DN4017_c2_g1_i1:81-692(+)
MRPSAVRRAAFGGMLRRTAPALFPVGGPYHTTKRVRPLAERTFMPLRLFQEGPVRKDSSSVAERGWVLKMIQLLQPITMHDLWEKVFTAPFNPVYCATQLMRITKHLRKDLMVYLRLDPDDLQFYFYVYPQWSRLVRNYIDTEKLTERQEDAKRARDPPPPYDPQPLRYYHQHLEHQEKRAMRRLEELRKRMVEEGQQRVTIE